MNPNDRNKLNRIEELKSKLFSKNYQTKREHWNNFLHQNKPKVPESWGDGSGPRSGYSDDSFFMKTSGFKKFFIFSIVFFLLTLGYASYVFFFAGNSVSNDNIDISILGNSFTAGGEELSIVVGITNRNSTPLELVDLVVQYPKGGAKDQSSETENFRESLGTIPAGGVHNENVKIILYGEQGAVRPIKVSIEYRVQGSNSIFVKEKPYQVTISSTPVNFLVDAPTTISPNQNIVLNVKSILNSNTVLPNVLLKVEYPLGFKFDSATPEPSVGNNVWNLGDLAPGVDRDISISGRMVDVFEGEEKSFRISSGSPSTSDKSTIGVVYNSLIHTVAVKKPFIEAHLAIDGLEKKEFAVDSKNIIRGSINWSNNLETKIDDLKIVAKISGNAYNKKSVTAQRGIYDSLSSSIVWDKFSLGQLGEVNPGDFGSVEFTISPIPLLSNIDGIINNPSINIEVSISGKQLIQGYESVELNNSESKVIKIITDALIAQKGLYYSGPFKNTGPIPPKVENETTYTIDWSLSNTSNSISKGEVRAVVPSWSRFIGPETDELTYNVATREVIWKAGRIPKGTGITGTDKAVSFQIGFTPLFSQVNTLPVIMNEAVLTGHDDFANVDLRVSKTAVRTELTEAGFPTGGGLVTQ